MTLKNSRPKLFIVMLMLLLGVAFVQAQDDPTPASSATSISTEISDTTTSGTTSGTVTFVDLPDANRSDPVIYGILIVLALLLVGAMVYGAYVTGFLAKLVPPETAASIFQSGFRLGLQTALNQAGQTKSPLDDEFFEEMARLRGLPVSKVQNPDGTFTYTVGQPLSAG